ncbi:hypothetical protein DUI87_27945 [Hirundo rustica rustica]|uniref:Uncharacterized protein n=1 Tax=Hirundo rustica rustica TaxID=333673 RepID=A0A3M0J327_HIRRU|nr:hypothetical protein DUI87_27945 [Hirundo rustica rustica]
MKEGLEQDGETEKIQFTSSLKFWAVEQLRRCKYLLYRSFLGHEWQDEVILVKKMVIYSQMWKLDVILRNPFMKTVKWIVYGIQKRTHHIFILDSVFYSAALNIYSAYDITCAKLAKALWDIHLPVGHFEDKRYVYIFGDRVRTGQYFSSLPIGHGVNRQADEFNSC